MYLKPSEIFFCQDSINNVFDKNSSHRYRPIGETLDALCDRRCSVSSIPTISVLKKDNKWFTADNRRLWVFRQLERLGKCEKIYVTETYYIPSSKFTTYNGGSSVNVRGSPGGIWHRKPSVKRQEPPAVAYKKSLYSGDEDKENVEVKPTIPSATDSVAKNRVLQSFDNFGCSETKQQTTSSITGKNQQLESEMKSDLKMSEYENNAFSSSSEDESVKDTPVPVCKSNPENGDIKIDIIDETSVCVNMNCFDESGDDDNNNIATKGVIPEREIQYDQDKTVTCGQEMGENFIHKNNCCIAACVIACVIVAAVLIPIFVIYA